jgi:hypothetical protein
MKIKKMECVDNMKYIKILPVLLCVLCLTGCCETENETGATTETSSEGETEGTTLQESYANESEHEENIQINEEEENLDESDSIEKIHKYKIPEQSFDVCLDDWGEVTFVSCKPSPDEYVDWKVASFYLIRDDQILYKFPYRFENNCSRGYIGIFASVGAVGFRDINDDKKEDIIIITYYYSGAGPTGMVPRPGVTIYLAGENEFYVAKDMIEDVEENIVEKERTIENIYNYLQQKE